MGGGYSEGLFAQGEKQRREREMKETKLGVGGIAGLEAASSGGMSPGSPVISSI